MKIAIMGTGGVGGYFGARLAAAGNDVTFIARGSHLAAMRANGLRVESTFGDLHLQPAKVVATPAEVEGADAIMFAVKLGDTEGAAEALAPLVAKGAAIFTFQNGVEGFDRIATKIGREHIVPGVARIASHISTPGAIKHEGKFARLEMGEADRRESQRVTAFHAACKAAGIDALIAPDIRRAQWIKFAMLAPFSGLTCVTRQTIGPLRSTPGTRALIEAAVGEVIAVGKAVGIDLKDEDRGAVLKLIDALHDTMTTSMAHDLAAGKPLEVDWLSGSVVRLAERHGVPAPTHRFITQALSVHAAGRKAAT